MAGDRDRDAAALTPCRAAALAALLLVTALPVRAGEDPLALARAIAAASREQRAYDMDSLAARAERALASADDLADTLRTPVLDAIVAARIEGELGGATPRAALAMARRALGSPRSAADPEGRARAAFHLGQLHRRAGDADSTERWFMQSLAWLPADAVTRGTRAALLARAAFELTALRPSPRADSLARLAESLTVARPDPDTLALALAVLAQARNRYRGGDLATSPLRFARGAALFGRARGATAEEAAWVEQLAVGLVGFSEGSRGSVAHLESLLVRVRRLPDLHPLVIRTLFQARSALSNDGQHLRAVEFGREAVVRSRLRHGRSSPEAWNAQLALAEGLAHLGDFREADRHARTAVAAIARAAPERLELRAYSHSVLGSVELESGRPEAAYRSYRESVRLRERSLGLHHFFVGYSLTRQAEAALASGRPAEARDSAQRALDISMARGVAIHTVDQLGLLSAIEYRLGRDSAALALADRVAAMADSLFGEGSLRAAEQRTVRWGPLRSRGREDAALAEALELARREREAVALVAAAQPERVAGAMAQFRTRGLDAAVDMAARGKVAPAGQREVWTAAIRSRALVFRIQAEARRRLRRLPAAPGAWAAADRARADLAGLMVQRPEGRPRDEWLQQIEHQRAAVEEADRRALGDSPPVATPPPPDIEALSRALPPGEALVGYLRHTPPAMASPDRSAPFDRAAYAVFVLRDGVVSVLPLGDAQRLDEAVARWIALAFTPPAGTAAQRARALERTRAAGARVRRAMWDPIAGRVAGASRIHLVPDGAVAQVDIAALPADSGGWLIERFPLVARLTTEGDLLDSRAPARNQGLLMLAAPEFTRAGDGTTAMRRSTGAAFPPLPQTRIEADTVCAIWREVGAGGIERLDGAAADEPAWRQGAPGRSVLHLATHGFRMVPGASEAAPTGVRGVGGVVEQGRAEPRPLPGAPDPSIAGLALSGAAASGAPAAADGRLTSAEIEAMDLEGVACAVLSACRTGALAPDRPEPIQGLYRSFRLAGVRQVVMSLGPVDDTAARSWMTRFYRAHLIGGAPIAEAAWRAAREQLAARRADRRDTHPSRWALFVAAGAP